MKMRPQFNLKPRDAEQFELIKGEAAREDISMNEYILRGLEGFYIVLKGQRVSASKDVGNKTATGEITQIPGGGVKNGGVVGEGGNNSRVDKRGVGDGIAESDAGAVLTGSLPAAVGGGGGKASGAENRSKKVNAAKKADTPAVSAGWFPNSLCPHGWQNSFACEKNNGGCKP